MSIRLEKDGELMIIRGAPDPLSKEGRARKSGGLGLWLTLILLVTGVLFPAPVVSALPTVAHTVRGFLGVIQ